MWMSASGSRPTTVRSPEIGTERGSPSAPVSQIRASMSLPSIESRPVSDADAEKRLAAEAAAELVEDGMTVGLGTGSTVAHLLPAIAGRGLEGIRCVATSVATEEQARELGIPVEEFSELRRLDIAIDGTDQVTPDGWLIKGGGGAHLREKIVAAAADRFVVISDSSKPVEALTGPVPLELFAFGLALDPRPPRRRGRRSRGRAAQPRRRRDRRLPRRGRRPGRAGGAPRGRPGDRRPRPLPAGYGQRGLVGDGTASTAS